MISAVAALMDYAVAPQPRLVLAAYSLKSVFFCRAFVLRPEFAFEGGFDALGVDSPPVSVASIEDVSEGGAAIAVVDRDGAPSLPLDDGAIGFGEAWSTGDNCDNSPPPPPSASVDWVFVAVVNLGFTGATNPSISISSAS